MSVETGAPEAVESWSAFGDSFRSIVEGIRERASVESVYGEPIEAYGKTVIPAARVAYGFGGGMGSAPDQQGGGSGGGAGLTARPVGALEVTDGETRFVRFGDRRRLGLALAVGLLVGLLLGRLSGD